jgi:hypothetical protein
MQQDEGSFNFIHEDWDSNTHLLKVKLKTTKGKAYRFGFVSSLISTAHHQDPQNEAIRIVGRAVSMGEKTLIEGHRKYWQNLWMNDIIIEGHAEDQKNVRMMLYHCYAFNDWKSYGISPMGLSGLGYNGHVFWDMDLWDLSRHFGPKSKPGEDSNRVSLRKVGNRKKQRLYQRVQRSNVSLGKLQGRRGRNPHLGDFWSSLALH